MTGVPVFVILPFESTVNGVIEVVLLLNVPAVTPEVDKVAVKEEVPEPVTSPVKVIVWSPVLVPEIVALAAIVKVLSASFVLILKILEAERLSKLIICKYCLVGVVSLSKR